MVSMVAAGGKQPIIFKDDQKEKIPLRPPYISGCFCFAEYPGFTLILRNNFSFCLHALHAFCHFFVIRNLLTGQFKRRNLVSKVT
jgi:hypothetical protein